MERDHKRLELRIPVDGGHEIAATLHLPDPIYAHTPLIVGLPGGGYARGYFDLPEPGYSQAAHHVAAGMMMLAIDHLGVGDSSIPPMDATSHAAVAAAGHQAVMTVVDRLRMGRIAEDVPPIDPAAVIACGQSMGGHIAVVTQALHRSFDAIACFGSSMIATTMPRRPGQPAPVVPEGASVAEAAALMTATTDWPWVFHWEDTPAALVDADLRGGMPIRKTAPPWGSTTIPGFALGLAGRGAVSEWAAMIDVPVLIGRGERDVWSPDAEELTAFPAATDLAMLIVPQMAHMHNFASTRAILWRRIDLFVEQVVTLRG